MAKIKIQGHASGTGVLTVTAPNTDTDRTITLPDGTGTLLTTDGDGSSLTGVGVDGISSSADATAITIDSSENVGIGTSSPQGKTHIKTASNDGNVADWADGQFLVSPGETSRSTGFSISVDTSANVSYLTSLTPSAAWRDLGYRALDHIFYGNGSTERMRITSDGRGLSQFTAKAWMRFDQYDNNALRDSHNVSSVTDHGTGEFTMNFSNNMGNAYYCVQGTGHYGGSANDMGSIGWTSDSVLTTSSARFYFMGYVNNGGQAPQLWDVEEAMLLIFGD